MDNVTHALAGLLIAECAYQLRHREAATDPERDAPASSRRRGRTITAIAAMVGANLPDADLLYSGAGGDPLAYMLHHRGYTHTVVLALVGAMALWAIALVILRRASRSALTGTDRSWLLATLVISTMSHLLLDWTNSYGIHPFWPFDSRWFYGDSVFIVEPWFWVVTIPTLVAASTSRLARGLLVLVLLAGLALAWWVSLVSVEAAAALSVGAVVAVLAVRALTPPARAFVSLGAWITVTVAMAAGTSVARATVAHAVHARATGAELLDVVVTPLPANPLCSAVITVERTGDRYVVQMARVSAAPALVNPGSCAVTGNGGPTFSASTRPSTRAVQWDREWSASIAELSLLRQTSCTTSAALRFLRVPVWRLEDASTVRIGDARFGGTAPGIVTLSVPRVQPNCPESVPPWTPPRSDVLQLPVTAPDR